jgi:hypothetical protein
MNFFLLCQFVFTSIIAYNIIYYSLDILYKSILGKLFRIIIIQVITVTTVIIYITWFLPILY